MPRGLPLAGPQHHPEEITPRLLGIFAAAGLTQDDRLSPFSLVCKAVSADGNPTVKLSDNPNKAMGPADQIARYKRVFGVGKQEKIEVVV